MFDSLALAISDCSVSAGVASAGEAPLAVTSSAAMQVIEGLQLIGVLTANKPGVTWSIVSPLVGFEIVSGNNLRFDGATLADFYDYELTGNSGVDHIYNVTVRATLGAETVDFPMTVELLDALDSPTFTSFGPFNVAENTTYVGAVGAVGNGTISYSILPAADNARFAIDSVSGIISFSPAPDYEVPGDAGADNVYNITVRATNDYGFTDLPVVITVYDTYDTNINKMLVVGTPSAINNSSARFRLHLNRGAGNGEQTTPWITIGTSGTILDIYTIQGYIDSAFDATTGAADIYCSGASLSHEYSIIMPPNGYAQSLTIEDSENFPTVSLNLSTTSQGADATSAVAERITLTCNVANTGVSDETVTISGGEGCYATFGWQTNLINSASAGSAWTIIAGGNGNNYVTFERTTPGAISDFTYSQDSDGTYVLSTDVQGADASSGAAEVQVITPNVIPTGGNWKVHASGSPLTYDCAAGDIETSIESCLGVGVSVSGSLVAGAVTITWDNVGVVADNVLSYSVETLEASASFGLTIS